MLLECWINLGLNTSARTTIGAADLKAIFASGDPHNQFELYEYERSRLRMPQTSPEMMQLFRALQSGDMAVASWRTSAEAAARGSTGFIEHARTIAGFSRGFNNTVLLHVIDPYGARQETWSFRDWVVASRMNMYFDNPLYSTEDIQKITDNLNRSGGVMSAVASEVMVIHKKMPKLVLTG